MRIPNTNIKFFYKDGNYFCSVKLPIFRQPVLYMNCGHDNRPFQTIVEDINLAFEMLLENSEYRTIGGLPVVDDLSFNYKLYKLLGYKLSNADLK